jgi:hypothetical protein
MESPSLIAESSNQTETSNGHSRPNHVSFGEIPENHDESDSNNNVNNNSTLDSDDSRMLDEEIQNIVGVGGRSSTGSPGNGNSIGVATDNSGLLQIINDKSPEVSPNRLYRRTESSYSMRSMRSMRSDYSMLSTTSSKAFAPSGRVKYVRICTNVSQICS